MLINELKGSEETYTPSHDNVILFVGPHILRDYFDILVSFSLSCLIWDLESSTANYTTIRHIQIQRNTPKTETKKRNILFMRKT